MLCGTTDTVMEVFASGAVNKGDMTLKLATAGRICVITDKAYPDINLINYSHITDGLWYPGTATKACAASYRWFRDTFGEDYSLYYTYTLVNNAENLVIGHIPESIMPILKSLILNPEEDEEEGEDVKVPNSGSAVRTEQSATLSTQMDFTILFVALMMFVGYYYIKKRSA